MADILRRYLHGEGTLEHCRSAEDFDELCRQAELDEAGRLRWQVERRLGVPMELSDRDAYLYALAQLRLDREAALAALCPACRENALGQRCACCGGALPTENPAFDEARYKELNCNEATAL